MAKRGSYFGGSTIIRVHPYPGPGRAIGALEIAAKEYDFAKTPEPVLVKKKDMTREELAERRRNQKVSSQTRRAKKAKRLAKQLASLPARQEKRARREEQRRLEKARRDQLRREEATAADGNRERRPSDPLSKPDVEPEGKMSG